MSAWAFDSLGLFRVQLVHAVGNAASCRVVDKAGYRLEGTLRLSDVVEGTRHDQHLHARLTTDG